MKKQTKKKSSKRKNRHSQAKPSQASHAQRSIATENSQCPAATTIPRHTQEGTGNEARDVMLDKVFANLSLVRDRLPWRKRIGILAYALGEAITIVHECDRGAADEIERAYTSGSAKGHARALEAIEAMRERELAMGTEDEREAEVESW